MKNIYLIGMMGAGKTSIGYALAKALNFDFVDIDQYIEEKFNQSIPTIFSEKGEDFFRSEETDAIEAFQEKTNIIFSTGGGIVERPQNIELMKKNGEVIYLRSELDTLWERVQGDQNRPLLKTEDPRNTLETILNKRIPIYESACDRVFDTDGKRAEQVAREIVEQIK